MIPTIPDYIRAEVPTGLRVEWRVESYDVTTADCRPRPPYHHRIIVGWIVPWDVPPVDAMRPEEV